MVAAKGTGQHVRVRSAAAAAAEDGSAKPPRKPRASRRTSKPTPLPLPPTLNVPAPSKWSRWKQEYLPLLWFVVPMVFAAYYGAYHMRGYLRDSGQLVSDGLAGGSRSKS
jgi:hypothetical protein